MADGYSICLVGIMDQLWFQQIILFSPDPCSSLLSVNHPGSVDDLVDTTETPAASQLLDDHLPPENSLSSESSSILVMDDSTSEIKEQKDRPTRVNITSSRARSQSSSPFPPKRSSKRFSGSKVLQKSMSCRRFEDLEMQEVKGFMDLGFIFHKENLSPRMISLVPGLQRLNILYNGKTLDHHHQHHHDQQQEQQKQNQEDEHKDDNDEEEDKKYIMRPYLSEAWLIKRPNSPLLNMRMPRAYAAAEMKQHLRSWARTVATVVEQES